MVSPLDVAIRDESGLTANDLQSPTRCRPISN